MKNLWKPRGEDASSVRLAVFTLLPLNFSLITRLVRLEHKTLMIHHDGYVELFVSAAMPTVAEFATWNRSLSSLYESFNHFIASTTLKPEKN